MNKQNLHKIIQDLIEIRGESGLKVTDDTLFIQAATYDRGESMDKSKSQQNKPKTSDSVKNYSLNEKDITTDVILPATANQISYLRKQGVKVNPNLTKQEAFIMIRNYKESLKRGNI